MLRKILLSCGIVSSLLYIGMNIFVPMQYPGYSSVTQTISELSAIDAPTAPLWVPLGIAYTLLMTAFGWGLWLSAVGNRPLKIAGALMTAYGIIGLAWAVAPMHQREVLAVGGGTISDTMHLVMATVSSLFMMTAMGFGAAAFGKKFRIYTIATILALLVFGALTGSAKPDVEANLPTPWLGVWERIMIGVFIIWVIVLVLIIFKRDSRTQNPAVN